ncbi:hypothetical protein BGW41_003028 [Actinomortierella wolfii]|nr:hypothetical protein BGW41_003028 [Actinomortierella wolfii]
MSLAAKAAATVQNNVLLVQYSPTGHGLGDLYAILLSDDIQQNRGGPAMTVPLPFQKQYQAPDLQGWTGVVASMSLATVPPSSGTNPSTPGSSPPSPSVPTPESVDGSGPAFADVPHPFVIESVSGKAAVAAPFRDVVLAVNGVDVPTRVWHVKPPTQSFLSPDTPVASPHPGDGGSESGPGTGPGSGGSTSSSNISTSPWTASTFPSSYFPNATSVTLGTHTPQRSQPNNAGILAVTYSNLGTIQLTKLIYPSSSGNVGSPTKPSAYAPPPSSPSSFPGGGNIAAAATPTFAWNQSWSEPVNPWPLPFTGIGSSLQIYPATVPASSRNGGGYSEALVGPCRGAEESICLVFMHDPPNSGGTSPLEYGPMPDSPCFTSTSNAMVVVSGDMILVNPFASPQGTWVRVTPFSLLPHFEGPAIACATTGNIVIVVAPDTNNAQPLPAIHLFDLTTSSWIKTQLVQAAPGTFGNAPIHPGFGDSGNPAPDNSRTAKSTTSQAALIGGIVGGLVLVAALIIAGFLFRRRRGAKNKALQQHNLFALKPLVGDDALDKERRRRDSEPGSGAVVLRGSSPTGGSERGGDAQEMVYPRAMQAPLQVATSVALPVASGYPVSTPMSATPPSASMGPGYDYNTASMPLTTAATLIPVTGTIGLAGDKGEITDREIQTISLRPPSAGGSHGSLVDDDNLEIVTHVGRSRSNIRGSARTTGGSTAASSRVASPTSPVGSQGQHERIESEDTLADNTHTRTPGGRKDSIESHFTVATEPITPALANAQLILQESQRRPQIYQQQHPIPPVPAIHPHYGTYPSQQTHQRYPSQPGNSR